MSDESLHHVIAKLYGELTATGIAPEAIREMLRFTEPFKANWSHTTEILDRFVMESSSV